MADGDGRFFENWKVSDLRSFLIARDVPVCDLPKVSLVQNCYLAVSLELQPNNSKSPDEYAQDIYQSKQGKLVLDGGMIRLPAGVQATGTLAVGLPLYDEQIWLFALASDGL